MTEPARNPTPGLRAVFVEQVRIVGLGLRREAAVLGAVLAFLTLMILMEVVENGETIDFEPSGMLLIAVVGLLLPFAVWKGEKLYGGGYLWTLPVERRRHAGAKVLAGAVWLGAALLAFLAWLLALALLTGGGVGGDETRLLLPSIPHGAPVAVEALTPVRWTTPAWEWVAPFTAGPLAYVLGSAFVLGFRRPVRTAAALVVAVIAVGILSEEFFPDNVLEALIETVVLGPYGIDAALTGGSDSLATDIKGPNGERVVAWRGLPSFERWAGATAIWAALGALSLWAALFRHREN